MFLQGFVDIMKPELRKQVKFIYFKIHNSTMLDEQNSSKDNQHSRQRESSPDIDTLSRPVPKAKQQSI
ncbi:MAG: hypothetical protein AAGB35_03295 [Pseudomonadota bacterium]